MASDSERTDSRNQGVERALDALGLLVRAGKPLTGTEVGEALGIHQTSASRLMRTLVASGYARAAAGGGFEPDLRVFAMGADAVEAFPLVSELREPMNAIAQEHPDCEITLATVVNGRPLYFLRSIAGERISFSTRRYPLHLSTASLRVLMELPEAAMLDALRTSGEELGWERPTDVVPLTPEGVLEAARRNLRGDALVISSWLSPTHISGAISIQTDEASPFVLAIISDLGRTDETELRLHLAEGRRRLENHQHTKRKR